MGAVEEIAERVEPYGLDLPGPSRRIKVEPLRLPDPAREPPPAEPPPTPPREPAKRPEREPARR